MTEAEQKAYEAGEQSATVKAIGKRLDDHLEKCEKRSDTVWGEFDTVRTQLNSHTKYICIGLGIVIALEATMLLVNALGIQIGG